MFLTFYKFNGVHFNHKSWKILIPFLAPPRTTQEHKCVGGVKMEDIITFRTYITNITSTPKVL